MRLPAEILVFRHAKSSWESGARTDFERPLSSRGKRDAPRMGRWLAEQHLVPDLVVSSPAKRARQTARRASEAMGLDPDAILFKDEIYEASLTALLGVLAECPEGRVMLVGHNPGLEVLVEHLAGRRIQPGPNGKLFPTATIAYFRDGNLVELVRPRELDV
ncbi:MAG: SixA phosphatase family protein [Planctomycetota bacterium]